MIRSIIMEDHSDGHYVINIIIMQQQPENIGSVEELDILVQ